MKSGYIDQLKDLDLVGSKLLPAVFGLLELYGGMPKAFKLELWDVDEFYLERESISIHRGSLIQTLLLNSGKP